MIDLSFVIPCYNEEGNVRVIYDAIHAVFDPEGISTEIVMDNDGSVDGTRKALKELYKDGKLDELEKYSKILYNQARLISGLSVDNPSEITNIICELISK